VFGLPAAVVVYAHGLVGWLRFKVYQGVNLNRVWLTAGYSAIYIQSLKYLRVGER